MVAVVESLETLRLKLLAKYVLHPERLTGEVMARLQSDYGLLEDSGLEVLRIIKRDNGFMKDLLRAVQQTAKEERDETQRHTNTA